MFFLVENQLIRTFPQFFFVIFVSFSQAHSFTLVNLLIIMTNRVFTVLLQNIPTPIGVSSPPFLGGHQSSALLKFNHKHYYFRRRLHLRLHFFIQNSTLILSKKCTVRGFSENLGGTYPSGPYGRNSYAHT